MCGKKRRTKGSVVQELYHFVILSIMTDSAYFVKSTPLGAFSVFFLYFADMLPIYRRCVRRTWKLKKINKFTDVFT